MLLRCNYRTLKPLNSRSCAWVSDTDRYSWDWPDLYTLPARELDFNELVRSSQYDAVRGCSARRIPGFGLGEGSL